MREIFHLLHLFSFFHALNWSPSPHIYRLEPPSPRPGFKHGAPWTDIVSQWGSETLKPEGGGAHGLVCRHPTGPTGLPFLRLGYSLGPLVNGWCLGLCYIVFLLWWALKSMLCTCGGVWLDGVLLLGWKGYDCISFPAKSCSHRNLEGHVEFSDLLVAWV